MLHLRSINLNLLPILRELLVQQSVTAAARTLNMSQSATSEALGRLRDLFEDRLLVQEGRNMRLTPFAKNLLPEVVDALESMEHIFSAQTFDAIQSQRKFTLSTPDMIALQFGGALNRKMEQQAPNAALPFLHVSSDIQSRLDVGAVDFLISPPGDFDSDKVRSTPLLQLEYLCIADAENGAAHADMTLQDYCKMRHVVFSPDAKEPWESPEASMLKAAGVSQRNVIYLPYLSFLPFIVENTSSVALVHRFGADVFNSLLNIKTFRPPLPYTNFSLSLYWSITSDHDPAHRWMRQFLKTVLAETTSHPHRTE